MKYFSFLLNLFLAATISYGGTIAGDENSSVETKDLTVHEKVTLYRPLVLDQDGFIAGLRYGEETNNIQSSIVLGNGAGINQKTKINDSIVIGVDAANSDDAKFKNMIIVGNNAGENSKLESSIVIGNYAGFGIEGETNSVFIDTYTNRPNLAYCGTNDAIYIHNGEISLGRGDAESYVTNRLRGNWEISGFDFSGYLKKWPISYYFSKDETDNPINGYMIGLINASSATPKLAINSGGELNISGTKITETATSSIELTSSQNTKITAATAIDVKSQGSTIKSESKYNTEIKSTSGKIVTSSSQNTEIVSGSQINATANNNITATANNGLIDLVSVKDSKTGGVTIDGWNFNLRPNMNVTVGTRYPAYLSAPYSIAIGTSCIEDVPPDSYPSDEASLTISGRYGTTQATGKWRTGDPGYIEFLNRGDGYKVGDDVIIKTSGSPWANGVTGTVSSLSTMSAIPRGTTVQISTGPIGSIEVGKNTRAFGAVGDYSMAIGYGCLAIGDYAIANGKYSAATGTASHAEGDNCFAYGDYAHAEGRHSRAIAQYSHAEGDNCEASGSDSHAEGAHSKATASYSHADGDNCEANAPYSYASGKFTVAKPAHERAWIWSGQADSTHKYETQGAGTFAIDPVGGPGGFWIGDKTLQQLLNGAGGSQTLADLTDTTITTPANNQVLVYDTSVSGGKWVNKEININDITALKTSIQNTKPENAINLNTAIANINSLWTMLGTWATPIVGSSKPVYNINTLLGDPSPSYVKKDVVITNVTVVSGGSNYNPDHTHIEINPPGLYLVEPTFNIQISDGVIQKVTVDNTKCTMNWAEEPTSSKLIGLNVVVDDGFPGSGATLSIKKVEYPYPQAEYTGYLWGENNFINSGSDYPQGNLTLYGFTSKAESSEEKAPPNSEGSTCMKWPTAAESNGDTAGNMLRTSTDYDPLGGATKFTVMGWIKRNMNSESAARIFADLSGTRYGDGVDIRFSSTTAIQIRINATAETQTGGTYTFDGLVPDGDWRHIVICYDSTVGNGKLIYYISKAAGGSAINSTGNHTYSGSVRGAVKANNYPLTLGCTSGGDSHQCAITGYMDDVRIFRDWIPSSNADVIYWRDKDDAYTTIPRITDPIELGEMDPDVKVYSADQIDELFGNSAQPSSEVVSLGVSNPSTNIYSAEQIDKIFRSNIGRRNITTIRKTN